MPDVNGKLSEGEKQKILDWVKTRSSRTQPYPPYGTLSIPQKSENMTCQVCGSRNWGLAEHLVTPAVLNATGIGLMNPSYPQAMLLCSECGSTIYINVNSIGLIKS